MSQVATVRSGPANHTPLPIVRVSAAMGSDDSTCAQYLHAKAHVTERVQRPRRRYERLDDFLPKTVFSMLDQLEGRQLPAHAELADIAARQGTFGPAEIAWIVDAVAAYPDLAADGLTPAPGNWVVSGASDSELRELYAWGRAYVGAGGRHRVMVLPVLSTATLRTPPPSKVAIAAYTTAFGSLSSWPSPWSDRFRPTHEASIEPSRVSIHQVGLLDGSMVELFSGTPQQARALYDEFGRAVAASAAAGGPAEPGQDCASCKLLDACEAVPRCAGLLGAHDPDAPLRQVSATTLRYHAACPRQARLSSVHLPSNAIESEAIQVGRVVDDVLNRAHNTPGATACTTAGHAKLLDADALDPAVAQRSATLLGHHAEICPRHSACDISDVQVQGSVVAFDPDASSVVIARPDLLYREDGDLVWRETTTSRYPPRSDKHLFDTGKRIQLALAVLLCHAKALGEPVARLEVEYLTDGGADVRYIDISDASLVAQARAVVEPVAQRWRCDENFAATPGAACASCAFTRWCPDAAPTERTDHA